MPDWFDSPFLELLLLAALAALGRAFFLRRADPPTAAGAIAMAIGIFVLGALQQLPGPVSLFTRWLTLGGLIVWAYLATAYTASYCRGTFHVHTDDPVGCFAIGTWVAGTAVLARLVAVALPDWRPLSLGMTAITVGVWLWYLTLITRRYRLILASPTRLNTSGRILLATVSTQSLLLVLEQLFRADIPLWLARGMLALGLAFYALGFVLIGQRYLRQPPARLADHWDNTNCILHGALSITGLAAVDSGALPLPLTVAIWIGAAGVLAVVEGIEIARLVDRVRLYGWTRGVVTYQVSQWARNFTFGMFYAFSVRLHARLAPADGGPVGALVADVVAWGHWVVLALLLVEVALFLWANIELHLPAQAPRPLFGPPQSGAPSGPRPS